MEDDGEGSVHSQDVENGITTDNTLTAKPARPAATEPIWVLIADDDDEIAHVVALVVEYTGYVPLVALNGRQALELARAYRPALVITDLVMPEVDGARLIGSLRAEAAAGGFVAPPIILMSAMRREHMPDVGADAVLSKPFLVAALEHLLRHFLGGAAGDAPSD